MSHSYQRDNNSALRESTELYRKTLHVPLQLNQHLYKRGMPLSLSLSIAYKCVHIVVYIDMYVWIKNKYKIYFSYLNVHQEEPQHAVDTGEDPNPSNDPLGSGHRAHCLSFHWMADSYVPG